MRITLLLIMPLVTLASALHLPMQRTRSPSGSPNFAGDIAMTKRTNLEGGLQNLQNSLYTAEVKVGDTAFTLALDTGSSDLWFSPGQNYNKSFASAHVHNDLELNITYGTGSVLGQVAQTDLIFANTSISNQSFLYITAQDSFFTESQKEQPLFQGIIGLGFDTLSRINTAVMKSTNQTWGRSLLSNIFLDSSIPNHIAFFLDRAGDLDNTDTGIFTIGTYAPGYENAANQPKHSVFTVYPGGVMRWSVLLTGLKVGGNDHVLETGIVADAALGIENIPPSGSLSVVLDTGASTAQLPPAAFKALYESMGGVLIKNESLTSGQSVYAVPCSAQADLEFTFGEQTILVHPLDLTTVNVYTLRNGQNYTVCTSAYTTSTYPGKDYDLILGDAFLRNVYAVYNYGELYMSESGFVTGTPFVQLLPLTDVSVSDVEFKQGRAKTLASLAPEVDVTTINNEYPRVMDKSGITPGVGSVSGASSEYEVSGLWTAFVGFFTGLFALCI